MSLASYYDRLTAALRFLPPLRRSGGYDAMTVHRFLTPDGGGAASPLVLHDRLAAALGPLDRPAVLDAGCGYGGTMFDFARRFGGRYDGLTLSAAQADRGRAEAARRGLDVHFHVASYDDPLPGRYDLIIAIESLAHALDPARTIVHLARALNPGGRIAVVDDMPLQAHRDLDAFKAGWMCPVLLTRAGYHDAFARAGLVGTHDEDLSARVPRRPAVAREALVTINRALARWPGAATRMVLDSYYGGLMLERLYAAGRIEYRMLIAAKDAGSSA